MPDINSINLIFPFLIISVFYNFDYGKTFTYTASKLFILIIIIIINFFNLNWRRFCFNFLVWVPFLIFGFISSSLAINPLLAIFGQSEIGDGFLYWLLVGIFTAQTAAISSQEFNRQKSGLLVGGVLLTCLIVTQSLHNFIDPRLTFQQLPNGFFSHKGHAAAVLLVVSLIQPSGIFLIGLLLTQTRIVLLIIPLIFPKFRKVLIIICLIVFLLSPRKVNINYHNHDIANSFLNNLSSGRLENYRQAIWQIKKSPLIGYGFNHFAQPKPWTYKAHNFILDKLIDSGILGTLTFLFIILNLKNNKVVLIYLIFTFFWYDCAQYSHLFLFLATRK